MKNKIGLGLLLSISATALLLTSCVGILTDPMNANVKRDGVYLEVKSHPKPIEIKERGNTKCPNGSSNAYGCLSVAKGDQAEVKFYLSSKIKSEPYHVTEMIICKSDEVGNKESQNCNLSVEEQAQFSVMEMGGVWRYPPDAKGVIDFSEIPQRVSEFKFINLNTIKQDYFYTIKACDSGNTDCRETDPIIKNGGMQ